MDQDAWLADLSDELENNQPILAVASRRRAIDQLKLAVEHVATFAILVTGEPGAGKTWLTRQLSTVLPASWHSLRIDLTRAMAPIDFFQAMTTGLGLPISESLGVSRARVRSYLHDEAADGRRWLLLVDEAHRSAPLVWDEIKVVVNQLGEPGGFSAIVVHGDTELMRTLATGDGRGFLPHVGLHLHLPPMDLDEARQLLGFMGHELEESDSELEELHRDARGNPRALLRLAGSWPAAPAPLAARRQGTGQLESDHAEEYTAIGSRGSHSLPERYEASQTFASEPDHDVSAQTLSPRREPSILMPGKPPLRVEEGLVEVGWDGDLDAEVGADELAAARATADPSAERTTTSEPPRHVAVDARTTSLFEAELEQVAQASEIAEAHSDESLSADPAEQEFTSDSDETASNASLPGVRAEGQHEFAPYSQLFTRLRPSKHP